MSSLASTLEKVTFNGKLKIKFEESVLLTHSLTAHLNNDKLSKDIIDVIINQKAS